MEKCLKAMQFCLHSSVPALCCLAVICKAFIEWVCLQAPRKEVPPDCLCREEAQNAERVCGETLSSLKD